MSLPAENVTRLPQPPLSSALTPMAMLAQAVERGANPDMIERLMGLQERWEKSQAKKQFEQALSAAKQKIKPIVRNKMGHNNKRYADLAAVADAVDEILSENGLQYNFRPEQAGKQITVTCIVFGYGHSTETPLSAEADISGNKTAIHALASTLTYLQRYSLMLALGLAAGNDDDGKAAGEISAPAPPPGSISSEQVDQIRGALAEKGCSERAFLQHVKHKSVESIPDEMFEICLDVISSFRRK